MDLSAPEPRPSSAPSASPPPLTAGALAATAASVLFVLAGYVINVVLGRALGPVDYGLFGVVIGLMTVVNALQTSGVPQALAKFGAEGRYSAADLLLTGGMLQMGSSIVVAVGLLVLADPIASLFGDQALAQPLRIAALAIPSYALFTVLSGIEGGRGRYVRQAWMLSIYSVAKAALAVSLGVVFSLIGAIAGYVLAPLVGSLASSDPLGFRRGRRVAMRPIVAYGLPLLSLSLLTIAYLNVDLFVVKSLTADPSAAGYYTAAQSIARVPYYLAGGLAIILLPAVARVALPDQPRAGRMVRDALRFGLVVIVPVAVLLVTSAEETVHLLYGEQYEAAVGPLRLLTTAMAMCAFFSLLTSLLAGIERTWRAVAAAGAGLATAVALAVMLVPGSGMDGAAIGSLLGALVALVLAAVATFRSVPFDFPWLALVRVAITSAVVGIICLNLHGTVALLVGIPALGLLYLALLILSREIGRDDWQRIRALLPADRTSASA